MSQLLPLCIDLDGTLTKTDTIYEAIAKAIKHNPLIVFKFPSWLKHGKAYFKEQLTQHVSLRVDLLPYNQAFLEYIREEKAKGHPLILVSGTSYRIAQAVAAHLGIFSEVIASDEKRNLSGTTKAQALVEKYGAKQFIYAGNSKADVPVWREAESAIVVNASKKVTEQAQQISSVTNIFPPAPLTFDILRRGLRIHQWVKNILLFIPLLMAHRLFVAPELGAAILGFFAFSFTASSIYLINDALDIEADRLHPRKKNRPLAAGTLSLKQAAMLCVTLLASSAITASFLSLTFGIVLLTYFCVTFAYSLYLKQVVALDVILLACVYTLRIFAGSAATGVTTSGWLFAFSMFVFLSLALIKRYIEVNNIYLAGKDAIVGRGYLSEHRHSIFYAGLTSGYISLIVLALYINSQNVRLLYTNEVILWVIIPLLFGWISRIWLLAKKGIVHDDPIVFAFTDKVSYLVGILTAAALVAAAV